MFGILGEEIGCTNCCWILKNLRTIKRLNADYPYRSCPSLTSKDKMVEVARSGSQLWYFKVAMQWWFMLYISMPVERGYSWNQPLWVNMMQIVLISSVTAGGKWFPMRTILMSFPKNKCFRFLKCKFGYQWHFMILFKYKFAYKSSILISQSNTWLLFMKGNF